MTLRHYEEQLRNRLATFAHERGIGSVTDFGKHDLRAFVVWLESVVTYTGERLTPRGKQMALDTAKRFLVWLYRDRLLAPDITETILLGCSPSGFSLEKL